MKLTLAALGLALGLALSGCGSFPEESAWAKAYWKENMERNHSGAGDGGV